SDPGPDRELAKRELNRMPKRSRRYEATRQTCSCTCPHETRGVLVHVAGDWAGDNRNAQGECPDERAVASMADDRIAMGKGTCVGDPVHDAHVLGNGQ